MNAVDTNAILNSVIILHNRSLAVYLSDATPWMGKSGPEVAETLEAIAEDNRDIADKISRFVIENSGDVAAGEFPMTFTSLHDLSVDYLLTKLVQHQQEAVQFLQQAAARLELAPMAKALVDEALGAARAHYDSLKELTTAA